MRERSDSQEMPIFMEKEGSLRCLQEPAMMMVIIAIIKTTTEGVIRLTFLNLINARDAVFEQSTATGSLIICPFSM
jgi:hypothetical protein